MNCAQVDELGGALAFDALETDERAQIVAHLASCPEPHEGVRGAERFGGLLVASTEPVTPTPALRERLMTSVVATPQRHAVTVTRRDTDDARPGWLERLIPSSLMRPVAAAAFAATMVLAVVAGALWGQLRERDDQLRAVADALAGGGTAYAVEGEAGSGYLVDAEEGASLVMSDVADLPDDLLYELWLLDAEGNSVAAGIFRPSESEEIIIVPLEEDPAGWSVFAVTVEEERVEQSTNEPVLVGQLEPETN